MNLTLPNRMRRGFLMLAALVAATTAQAQKPIPMPPTWSAEFEARDAATLVDSLGINVHMGYNRTAYNQVDKVQEALTYLGLRNVRDVTPNVNYRPFDTLASHGTRFNFILRAETVDDLPQTMKSLEAFAQRYPGAVLSMEGLNEANNWPAKFQGLTGYPAAVAVQKALFNAVKSSAVLKNVPVYALTLGGAGALEYAKLGDISDYADAGNAHIYFGNGSQPSAIWDRAYALNGSPTRRLRQTVVTETGYTTVTTASQGVDEQTQAKYLLAVVAKAWARNVPRTFIYQLVDDGTDQGNWTHGLGLFKTDWTPKVAAQALHNLTTVLLAGDHPATATLNSARRREALDYKLSASRADSTSILMRRPDGSMAFLVWREQRIWDPDARRSIAGEPSLVSIQVPSRSSVQVFDLLTGKRTSVATRNGTFDFNLPDYPVVVELPPATASK